MNIQIGSWTQAELRRYIVNNLLPDLAVAKTPTVYIPVTIPCSASVTLPGTLADIDVTGCSASLPPGTYILWGVFDFAHTVNGGGVAVGKLNVGGSLQTNQALLLNTGSANGDRATVGQVWVFQIGAPATVKLQAAKTINAGTAQAVLTNTTMTYQQIA